MAIAFKGDAILTVGQGVDFAPAMPTHAAGDMLLAIGTWKPFDSTQIVSGWTSLGRGTSGTTAASAADLGSMQGEVWWKEATSAAETAPTFDEQTPVWNVGGGGVSCWQKDAGETWVAPVIVYGADEDLAADVSATMASDPGVTAGDGIQMVFGSCSDGSLPATGGPTITQTGVTFGAVTKDRDQESTAGLDHGMVTGHCLVSSGTGSAAPVLGLTCPDSGSPRWIVGMVRLRVSAAGGATSLVYTPNRFQHLLIR